MGIFDSMKAKVAVDRLSEESLYAEALREIESGTRRDGIWAMAMVECDMDQGKAAARYIKLRVQAMKDELYLAEQVAALETQRQQEKQQIEAERDYPRHSSCGGVIVRTERGDHVTWVCRKCGEKGKFYYKR
jgi:hypothetical protein